MGIPGLGYIEGMCHQLGLIGYELDTKRAAELLVDHYQKLPSYCFAAVNTFTVLFDSALYVDLIKVAPKALNQLSEHGTEDDVGQMECDIALALVRLHEAKTPVPFPKTPKQLLQSAGRRGYAPASCFSLDISKLWVQKKSGSEKSNCRFKFHANPSVGSNNCGKTRSIGKFNKPREFQCIKYFNATR